MSSSGHHRIFKGAVDADGNPLTLATRDGRFTYVGAPMPDMPEATGAQIVDLQGKLVLPGFVDGHIHLDKSFVGDRWRPHRCATTLRERLAAEKQEIAAAAPMAQRADALMRQTVSFGTVSMRCHVDVDASTGLTHLNEVMAMRDKWREWLDIELVAFPQAGVMSCPGTAEVLEDAVRAGVQVIGGIDPTTLDGDPHGQLNVIFGIAEKHGTKIDIHLHEPGDIGLAQLHRIASRTQAGGLQGRVSVSHAYGLGDIGAAELDTIARALADAGVCIMTNAPGDRAFPPILRLREAGVCVFTGSDNIQDSWWPYGNGDMLQRAMLIGYRSGFYTDDDLRVALEMATTAAARVIGKADYGLHVGNEASFVVFDAPHAAAAVAAAPAARAVIRHGRYWGGPAQLALDPALLRDTAGSTPT
ncbi:cytosine deaminase [Pandoraea faecigallinarum]|uniref:Cytosine deaminase n=1 Tax=Pandoraea faecigallinarum TaxID=656179 RepID=A0A0H3WLZ6_9BURK|nr:amidohydrolase family protein [Pandoraea faecigallinarum]AKM32370.1 cytosine deaminase [Pandoraea faecigallinarum]